MQQVSFTTIRNGDETQMRCDQTGVVYSFERDGVEYVIRNSGVEIARLLNSRDMAISFIGQTAALDFRTAQADCGQYCA